MKALVTGSAGFLGRHFTVELKARGWEVIGADVRQHYVFDALNIFRGGPRQDKSAPYDLVVHCAAVEPHRAAIDGQPMHLAQNLLLDSAMFDWAVRTGQKRVLYISSCAAYPVWQPSLLLKPKPMSDADVEALRRSFIDAQSKPHQITHLGPGMEITPGRTPESEIDLDRPAAPFDSYGWLKLTGEKMAADAARAGLPVHVVRPWSGYGEDQGENWPFGAFMSRARRREDPFVIWGDGTQVRDWIHVSDLVAGALEVVEQDVREPVNLCTGIGTSMAELVQLACKTAGYEPDVELRTDKPAGVAYRVGDPTRFHQIYTPKVTLAEGVERALA